MHRFIHFLWITSIFRKHCSHKHLRVLHTKTFFPQKLSTFVWISASSRIIHLRIKNKTPCSDSLEKITTRCSTFHSSFQLIRLKSVLQSGLPLLTAVCLHGNRRFPHRFLLPVHTGFCADQRCSLRLRRSFP